ncbi:hypothetical protein Tco_1079521 [Tanacetum coccineum]|uniref:Uncharacterized protein n=1 Tax=Tanacetum coccineum TaxID=301880 RepID=A0ABQ5HS35_9ASTR
MCKEEEKQKSIDTVEYEYGDIDLEFEEEDEDEDEDEYDGIYRELEEENIDNFDKEDFEQVEELKPLCVSSWIHPKSGETRHGIEVVARKDDAQVDFDDYTNLCLATRINLVFLVGMYMECHVLADGLKSLHAGGRVVSVLNAMKNMDGEILDLSMKLVFAILLRIKRESEKS